ncbi:hypothetical protein LSH36_39g00074 [Paralvinella palmiformis]|uniref:Fucosyltransferase n=1 Tax=Paralvinella palmiformis TaxID=53620 RepID=A0AAD9K7Z6_9ANNE|nr:hypothetical protein LSH36_39g00074 [Paralvinella palmiformis]
MTTSHITLSTCGISRDCGFASKDKSPKGIEQNSKDFEAFPKDKSFFGNETFLGGSSTDVQANTEVITILFWNGWFKSKDYGFGLGLSSFREKCGTNRCRTVTDRNEYCEADVVVVFAAKLKYSQKPVLPPKSSPEQIYVFLNTEPPTKYHTKLSRIRPQFNITISYRADSTIQWPYGKVIPRVGDYQPMNEAEMTTRNRTAAWLVSGCTDVNIRMTYFKEMTKYIQVDVYGKCGELKCPETNSQTTECMEYLSKHYKFYLAFENSHCVDYVTEKAFRSLQYDLIPIVMGGANYTKYLPPKSYIDVKDFQSPKHLAEYLIHLDNNPDDYMKYFDWKRYYTVVNDIPNSDRVFCELCELLRKKRNFLLDYNVADWWENDTCVNDVTMLHNIYHVN